MKTLSMAPLVALIFSAVAPFAQAEEPASRTQIAVLVEEGGGGHLIVVPGTTTAPVEAKDDEQSFLDHFKITGSALITAPLPIIGVGGRVGVSGVGPKVRDMIEIGAEAVVVSVVPDKYSDGAIGLQLGGYVQLAPVPGNWGRRFYIRGSIYRVFAVGQPDIDAWGYGGALGYRQPFDNLLGKPGYLYFELGLDRQVLFEYQKDVLITPRGLTIGLAW